MKEQEFLESLFKDDDKGTELQFFKESIFETKLKIFGRIMKLREDAISRRHEE